MEITSEFDLIYLDEYRTADDKTQEQAREMFLKNKSVNQVIHFCRKEKMKKNADVLREEANLSKRFATRTFKNFIAETEKQIYAKRKALIYVDNIEENIKKGRGIIFVGKGNVGTGKTHLACAIANRLLDNGYPVKVINVTTMINQIKKDFDIKPFLEAPILVLDDLGKEIGTQWVCETLYTLFNQRYEDMKPFIITTENTMEEIEKNYTIFVNGSSINRGKAIVSRLAEDYEYIVLDGEDYRKRG